LFLTSFLFSFSGREHELLKQLNIMNKELKLPRTQTANTNTIVPLQNVTNLLETAANVLPSTSTNAEMEDSSKSTKKSASANPTGTRCRWQQNSTRERK